MRTGRTSVALGLLLSAGLVAGCTVYTHSSSSPPPRSQSKSAHHHSSGSSHSSKSGSSSSSSSSGGGGIQPTQPADPAQPAGKPTPAAMAHMRRQLIGLNRGVRTAAPGLDVPPWSNTTPDLVTPGVAEGRPAAFRPGAPAAYWIWQGPRGDWRLRTTTASAPNVFRGRFKGMTSGVVNVSPTRTEFRDRIAQGGDGWMFNFRTQGHADGFTFSVQDGGCVRFDLHLDGGPVPKKIYIGAQQVHPKSSHFVVCPRGKTASLPTVLPR